ncbi:cytochrome b/b6 domain-containing protein [Streptomyces sp. NPDC093252]|uniref:cytochrome b/b6 domain-containing protein n=1 Tax=Streptomyces sp. NPDC093252 TaxID=3154980 RepID=UPI00341EC675
MNPRRSTSSIPRPGRSAYGAASAAVLILIPVVVLVGGEAFREFLNFGAGVLSLVCLSCSVIWGLVAQDRIVLNARQRIVGQAVHRSTAVAALAFLLLHITTKIVLDHTEPIAAVIPFSLGFTSTGGLIGLGTLAGLMMIFVGITGALRGAFASPAPVAARWRAMHMLAYPAWCGALVHGLYAGREAKPVFVFLYGLSLAGVMGALALRAAPRPVKRRVADRITALLGTGDRPGREDLDAARARAGEPTGALPGYEPQRATRRETPSYDTSTRAGGPESTAGFAAAYRAVSRPARPDQSFDQSSFDQSSFDRSSLDRPLLDRPSFDERSFDRPPFEQASFEGPPFDQPFASGPVGPAGATGPTPRGQLPDFRGTEPLPRTDTGGSTSGSWPIPSPPPVGEAPPSAYDPLQDTGHSLPTYSDPGAGVYGGRDVYDTGESNTVHDTYNPGDTYNSGPATESMPGFYDFEGPGSGEPWNTPSGGTR